jgi:hypothetical protein
MANKAKNRLICIIQKFELSSLCFDRKWMDYNLKGEFALVDSAHKWVGFGTGRRGDKLTELECATILPSCLE